MQPQRRSRRFARHRAIGWKSCRGDARASGASESTTSGASASNGSDQTPHPDIAIPKIRTLIEIRGCFWHRHEGCPTATMPKTNKQFWRTKFKNNVARDRRHEKEWAELGWNLIVIWECGLATLKERERTFRKVEKWLGELSNGV